VEDKKAMAEIKPFRAWRYNEKLSAGIGELTSPLFDVVSPRQLKLLYSNPLNSIHLSVPMPPNAADRAADLLEQWKRDRVIRQDALPGIYVYYQYFKIAGSPRSYCRKGFICNIRVYDWDEKVILRHENTIPKSVNDRIELLEKTSLNVSPTHGLYTDPSYALEKIMDEAITDPIFETEDYQGVRDVLAVIHDMKAINRFIEVLATRQVILADGHHRYEGSLIHMHNSKAANGAHTGNEAYNFHMMYLTNTEAGDFQILPTHRLITGLNNFEEERVLELLAGDFNVAPVEPVDTLNEVIAGKPWTFGILFRDRAFRASLKPSAFPTMSWHFPEEVKRLDLTVMHFFIIEKVLGIAGKEQRTSEHIGFDRSFSDCLARVIRQEAQMAIITQEVTLEEVLAVCKSGYTMPQKSTYFYPKVVCGFVFSSILENEFVAPPYSGF
jgi:uncharacterized protein (DUF1015 family)